MAVREWPSDRHGERSWAQGRNGLGYGIEMSLCRSFSELGAIDVADDQYLITSPFARHSTTADVLTGVELVASGLW